MDRYNIQVFNDTQLAAAAASEALIERVLWRPRRLLLGWPQVGL